MILDDDRVVLPGGVRVANGQLHDEVRGTSWSLSDSAVAALDVLSGRTVAVAAGEFAARFGLDRHRAASDLRGFCGELNVRLLINVERSARSRARTLWAAAVFLVLRAVVPVATARRVPLTNGGGGRVAAGIVRTLAVRAVFLSAGAAAVFAAVLAPVGAFDGEVAAAVGAATGGSVLLHEAGHGLALGGVPTFLAVRGLDVFLVHRPLRRSRRSLVAISGPALAGAAGWLLCGTGGALDSAALSIASLLLLAQPLALTVLAGDGRIACGLR